MKQKISVLWSKTKDKKNKQNIVTKELQRDDYIQ